MFCIGVVIVIFLISYLSTYSKIQMKMQKKISSGMIKKSLFGNLVKLYALGFNCNGHRKNPYDLPDMQAIFDPSVQHQYSTPDR